MRPCFDIASVVCMLAASLTVGCSRDDPADSTSNVPTREVNETRTPVVDGTSTLAAGTPVREAANGQPAMPRPAVREDADESGPLDSARNADSLTPAIPFSPVSVNPPDHASQDQDRRGDEDDPDAPVVVAKPEIVESAPPVLDNGRGGMLVPPSRTALSKSAAELALDAGQPSQPVAEPAHTDDTAPSSTSDVTSRQIAEFELGDSGPRKSPPTESATPAPDDSGNSQLAARYVSLDQDGDGQIGLYEWPREKLAEFQKLDGNHDGFLTPEELVE